VKGQVIKIPDITRRHPGQVRLSSKMHNEPLYKLIRFGVGPTTCSLPTVDDMSIPTRLQCYTTCYRKVIMKNRH